MPKCAIGIRRASIQRSGGMDRSGCGDAKAATVCVTTNSRPSWAAIRLKTVATPRATASHSGHLNHTRRRRSASPARPTSIKRPLVGSGTAAAVYQPADTAVPAVNSFAAA